MKTRAAVFAVVLLWAASSFAAVANIEFRSDLKVSNEPLHTSEIPEIDPGLTNPHLARWALGRKVELMDLKLRPVGERLLGVSGGVIQALTTMHLRGPGPWYSDIKKFPCGTNRATPAFATEEGARDEAAAAAKLWDDVISSNRIRLAGELQKISAFSQESVSAKSGRVFREWLVGVDREWRAKVVSKVRADQWKKYIRLASLAKACPSKKPRRLADVDTWMPIPPGDGSEPLVRAPARRWNGYFAVRMDVRIGDGSLNGQFLIDPEAPTSVLSPDWLVSQGIQPATIEIPEASLQRVKVGAGAGEHGLARLAEVDGSVVSGFRLGMQRFLIAKTELFDQPNSVAACCSGVLGQDFLRRYSVEFRPGKQNEVWIWPNSYRPPEDYRWIEMRLGGASDSEIQISCTKRAVNEAETKTICRPPLEELRASIAPMIFSLPDGRLWYSPAQLVAPARTNLSGVHLRFGWVKGDRVLEIASLGSTPSAKRLAQDGLHPGSPLEEINGDPGSDLDLWEVNRRLSGVYGNTVSLKWKTPHGEESATIFVGKQ